MITLGTEQALAPYRAAFDQMAIGAVVIPRALPPPVVREVRQRIEARRFEPFRLLHRGHYAFAAEVDEPALLDGLRDLACYVTGVRLALLRARCLRLVRGDYALSRDDVLPPLKTGQALRRFDVTADLSDGSCGEAQVVYAYRGENFFAIPQMSGCAAVVERRAGVTRYQRYLGAAVGQRVVYRLRLELVRPAVAETAPPPGVHSGGALGSMEP